MAPLFPEEWHRFGKALPPELRGIDRVSAYHQLLNDPEEQVRLKAARDWHE